MIAPGRLIPVMDIRRGEVVHARAGDRQSYRTLRSPLIGQTLRHTALQLLQTAGSTRLYVADLDALLGEAPSEAVTQLLHELPECEILLDRGRQLSRELPPNVRPVLPLEAGWSAEEHAMLLPRWQAAAAVLPRFASGAIGGRVSEVGRFRSGSGPRPGGPSSRCRLSGFGRDRCCAGGNGKRGGGDLCSGPVHSPALAGGGNRSRGRSAESARRPRADSRRG